MTEQVKKKIGRPAGSLNKATIAKQAINKVSSESQATSRLKMGNIGYLGLNMIGEMIYEELHQDLRFPKCIETFDMMSYNSAVAFGLNLQQSIIERAFSNYEVKYNKKNPVSVKAAEFLRYNLENMSTSLRTVIREASQAEKYGFSIIHKSYKNNINLSEFPEYRYMISKLSPRSPKSLDTSKPFVFDDDGNELIGVRQSTRYLPVKSKLRYNKADQDETYSSDFYIPREKFMLFSPNATNGNPQGSSPLKSAYKAWREMELLSDIEVVGASKDTNGMPILRVPADIINAAATDPASTEAQTMEVLKRHMASLHAGEQSFMILPSNLSEDSTMFEYDISLLGNEGAARMFDTTNLIQQRQTQILNCFSVGFMALGQTGSGGSYSLSDTQKSIYDVLIQSKLDYYVEVFNRELGPQLFSLNGIKLKEVDMPRLSVRLTDGADPETTSKVVQRAAAVSYLPRVPELVNEVLEELGFEYRLPDDTTKEQMDEMMLAPVDMQSKSGQGMEEGNPSGTGKKTGKSGDSSVANNENV